MNHNVQPTDPARLLERVRAALAPDSSLLEARMDRAASVDSEVVRYLRRLLGVRPRINGYEPPAPPSSLERDQEHGDERRGPG
jgi:hypothetical protein